jgi:hypothetical protein
MRVSPHFDLGEFMPLGTSDAPPGVVANIVALAEALLEPVRNHFGVPMAIHSGYRPPEKNAEVGGVPSSDHETGSAADFNVSASAASSWEQNTIAAFNWLRENRSGDFGQLILEDHRAHYGSPMKLWVHVALKTAKHAGAVTDHNRVLVSHAPKQYQQWLA